MRDVRKFRLAAKGPLGFVLLAAGICMFCAGYVLHSAYFTGLGAGVFIASLVVLITMRLAKTMRDK